MNNINRYKNHGLKICVVGAGYVGTSMAILLAEKYDVVLVDINSRKVDCINQRISPIKDNLIEEYLLTHQLHLSATSSLIEACQKVDYVIIATPTNYNEKTNAFDTHSVETCIDQVIDCNNHATIVIKSTIPVGFTHRVNIEKQTNRIIFSPEFLRESFALYDNLYPSRIIVGVNCDDAIQVHMGNRILQLLCSVSLKEHNDCLLMNSSEAEAVKLFSNTYLALRVAYFNELDTYAETNNLNTKSIIQGVCLDPRIGQYYNNPSFGYGGYCLPKDTKQLLANYHGIPEKIITAIVESNELRKSYIAQKISDMLRQRVDGGIIGIYRLIMKSNSDNFRNSAMINVISHLEEMGHEVIIYEPLFEKTMGDDCHYEIVNDFNLFVREADIIITNRYENCLNEVKEKVYTRDLFFKD